MHEANYFTFRSSSSRKKSGIYFFRVPPGNNDWNTKWRKALRERILKIIFVCEIHYPEYQLIMIMYKITTSQFLQKSLQAYHNSGRQSNCKFLKTSNKASNLKSLKQSLLGLMKKDCISFINNKQQIFLWIIASTISKILWSFHLMLIFRLDIFHPKILLYYSWGKENALKTKQNMQNIFCIRIPIYIIKSLYV